MITKWHNKLEIDIEQHTRGDTIAHQPLEQVLPLPDEIWRYEFSVYTA